MPLVGAERSAWKSQRATANAWAQSRGALLILNLLLYFICPVSAVAALPGHHFRDPPDSNSTIVRLPKWHTRFIANSSLSTWGSTFASGSHLMTMFPVDTAQGRPSSSQFQGFILASHRPHNVTTLPSSANVTYRRDSTTSISTSSSRHLNSSDQQAATRSHSTNISANVTHRRNNTASLSPSPHRYLKFGNQEATKTHYSTNVPSRSIRLPNNSTQANYGPSSSHYSISNIPRPSSLSRNTTRANYDITTAGVSLAKASSISPCISSITLPSSSSSRSHPSMTPLHTSSSSKPSGPSSFSSTTRATLPPAISSVASSQSSLASTLPKPLTPTPSVTSGPSLSTNLHPFSLPPGCKLTAFGNETYILIPTERARKVHQPSPSTITQAGADGYDNGPSPSTTSQAGADAYDTSVKNPFQEDKSLDKELIDHSPSSQTSTVILATVLGIVPTCFAFPYAWYKFRKWRLEKNKKEKKTREGPEDPAEEAQDMYKTVKKGKWTERLASWLKDVEEFNPKATKVTPIWPTGAQRLIRMIQGPTFDKDIRQLKEPFERDPGSCNYMNSKESLGCLEPPEHWPRPAASEEGAERLSHQESLDLAERLPRAKVDWLVKNDIPMQILKVPEGYARLTLDGKIAYLGQNKLSNADPRARRVRYSVADPRIRYFDRRCAAVGPGNSPLGGINVDDLWIDKEGKFTLKGTRLDPNSDVVQQYKMIRYENARFVRQNFPSNRFEGGSRGSKYNSNGKGDRGKGKGKAKAWSLEVLEDGLNLAQKQAIDLQMDHDLAQTPDQMIRDWLKKNQQYAKALHPPSIENMRKEYWAQNNVEGPGPGDFDDWGNRSPEVPQTAEVENPPDSDSDSDDSVVTVIHNPVGNGVSSEPEGANDDQNAKAKEEAIRDQIRKADEALRKEEAIRDQTRKADEALRKEEAIRDQIRKADEALRKAEDKRIRESERREAARKELEAMEEEGRAREEAVRRMRQEEGIEEEEAMEEEETLEEEAVRRGRPRRKPDGKGNGQGDGKGDKNGKTDRGNGDE